MFRYINEFTFQTNKLLGENNMKLTWKGPYHRHDAATSASKNLRYHFLSYIVVTIFIYSPQ